MQVTTLNSAYLLAMPRRHSGGVITNIVILSTVSGSPITCTLLLIISVIISKTARHSQTVASQTSSTKSATATLTTTLGARQKCKIPARVLFILPRQVRVILPPNMLPLSPSIIAISAMLKI